MGCILLPKNWTMSCVFIKQHTEAYKLRQKLKIQMQFPSNQPVSPGLGFSGPTVVVEKVLIMLEANFIPLEKAMLVTSHSAVITAIHDSVDLPM